MENEEIVEFAHKVFIEGDQVLVVGVIPSNMGKWWELQKRDSRLHFLDMRAKKQWRIPKSARLVIATGFRDYISLRSEFLELNKDADVSWPQQSFSTGEIQAILEASYFPMKSKVRKQLKAEERITLLPIEEKKGEKEMPKDVTVTVTEKPEPVTPLEKLFVDFKFSIKAIIDGLIAENLGLREKITSLNFDLELSNEQIKDLESKQLELQKESEDSKVKLAEAELRVLELETGQNECKEVKLKLAEAEAKLAALRVFKEAFINI